MLKRIYIAPVLVSLAITASAIYPATASAQLRFPLFSTPEPTIQPDPSPSADPTATATPVPSGTPIPSPSGSPLPSSSPIASPQPSATAVPSLLPSATPTPTAVPTESPSPAPVENQSNDSPPTGIVAGINNIIDAIQGNDNNTGDDEPSGPPSTGANIVSKFIEPLTRPFSNNFYQQEGSLNKQTSQIITVTSIAFLVLGIALLWKSIKRVFGQQYLSFVNFIKNEFAYRNERFSTS